MEYGIIVVWSFHDLTGARQMYYWGTYQVAERYNHFNIQYHGSET